MNKFQHIIILLSLICSCTSTNNTSVTESNKTASHFSSQTTVRENESTAPTSSETSEVKGDAIFTHSTKKGRLYHHENYSFSYSEEDEQSEWVAYELTKEETYGKLSRSNAFTEDPIVSTESAHVYEYRESGYTKGHLAPAADMKFDRTAMMECFYTSNISPQKQKFNAGIWNDLEMQTRHWARKFNKVYIVTGPVFSPNDEKMHYTNNRGEVETSEITIPAKFFKIIYDFSYAGKEKMIGFIIPQSAKGDIFEYAVTVDEVEKATGIDFFNNIAPKTQDALEGNLNISAWQKFLYENKYNN